MTKYSEERIGEEKKIRNKIFLKIPVGQVTAFSPSLDVFWL